MTDTLMRPSETGSTPPGRGVLRRALAVAIVTALAVIVGTGGYLWGHSSAGSAAAVPAGNSVDAGFARDMSSHHQQAVTMATYTRDNSDSLAIRTVAYDIESSQSVQMGEMSGWLEQWGYSRNSATPMSWMSASMDGMSMHVDASGLMPGMATPAQMSRLLSSHGAALDILFLQLMIHHHQGGLEMAKYAAEHADKAYVRTLAAKMYDNQGNEIVQMERTLRERGGTPLPPPN